MRSDDGLIERLLRHVEFDPETGCWLWVGSLSEQGYARAQVAGRIVNVSRVVYNAVIGPVPDEVRLEHTCRIKRCINPDHAKMVLPKSRAMSAALFV